MARKIVISLIALLIIIISFYTARMIVASKAEAPKKQFPKQVKFAKTVRLEYQNYPAVISATGRLRSANKTKIISEVQGRLNPTEKDFRVGSNYKKDQTLISIDKRELENQIRSQKASFLSILTKIIPTIKLDYNSELNSWETYLNNFEFEGLIQDLPKVDNSNLKLFLNNNNIYASFFNIKNLELQREKYEILSPFNSSVVASNIEKGGLVVPGQVIGEIVELNNYELELQIPENEAEFVSINNRVEIYNNESSRSWNGRVARKSNNIDYNTQTRSVFVKINSNDLADGMYLSAKIIGSEIKNVFKIQRSSLINNKYVNILNNESKLERKSVIVHINDDKYTLISGLDSNTTIVDQALPNVAIGTEIVDLSEKEEEN